MTLEGAAAFLGLLALFYGPRWLVEKRFAYLEKKQKKAKN
jgi:hypothetical protein